MSGKDEIPAGIIFKDGIDFPTCEYCFDFNFWECLRTEGPLIFFNPKRYQFRASFPVVIYRSRTRMSLINFGKLPTLNEMSTIEKIVCNHCSHTPREHVKIDMITRAVEYIVWFNRKELKENVRKR